MRLLGQITQTEPLIMVVEYMSRGNLRDLLQKNKCGRQGQRGGPQHFTPSRL
jgi:hypothetical protein